MENLENSLPVKFDSDTAKNQSFEVVEKLQPSDRYKLTENGISHRWLPGSSKAIYFANGDEHTEDGSLTEEAGPSKLMIEKRIKKLNDFSLNIVWKQINYNIVFLKTCQIFIQINKK